MRKADDVLRDLDSLRDRRYAGTIEMNDYYKQHDELWDELRAIDREAAIRQEQQKMQKREARKQARIARSQRRLARLLAQPRRKTRAEHRAWLEEFVKIGSSNQPGLRARQRRIKQRLERSERRTSVWYPKLWTPEERMERRARATGDAKLAVQIAERFHRFVRPLYVSRHAKVVYGRGGQEGGYWSGKYHNSYKLAGVWIDYDAKMLWMENSRQSNKHGLPLPDFRRVTFECLEDCDLWGITYSNGRVERYALVTSGILACVGCVVAEN